MLIENLFFFSKRVAMRWHTLINNESVVQLQNLEIQQKVKDSSSIVNN